MPDFSPRWLSPEQTASYIGERVDRLPRLLRAHQVAAMLDVSVRQVQLLTAAGKLPGLKVGSSWRFDPADLEAWLLKQKPRARQRTYSAAAVRGTRVSLPPVNSSASAYEQLIFGKQKSVSKESGKKQIGKPLAQ